MLLRVQGKQTFFNFADKNANWFKLWKSVSEVRNHLRYFKQKGPLYRELTAYKLIPSAGTVVRDHL